MYIYKSPKKRKDGYRWGYNIYVPDPLTGKGKRVTKETFRTKKEAKNAARRMLNKIENGEVDPLNRNVKTTVNDLFDGFINHYSKTGVTESTVRITEQGMRKHFVSEFGEARVINIQTKDLNPFFENLATKLKNYRAYYYYVSQFFEYVKTLGLRKDNPMDNRSKLKHIVGDDGKRAVESIPVHYTEKELEVVLNTMKEYLPSKQYTYFLLLAKTGLRKSEGLALYKEDIDLGNMRITVNKTLTTDRQGKTIVAEGTKSRARNSNSSAVLPLDPELKEPLQEYIDKTGRYNETNYFFPSPRSKNGHLSMTAPDKWLRTFYNKHMEELKELGVTHRIKVHGFRHTFVSILQASNYNPNVIMYLTRHANLSTTMDYSHFDVQTIEDLMN